MIYQDVVSAATATIAKIWSAHSGRTGQRFYLHLEGDTCGIAPTPGDLSGAYGWRLQMPAMPLDAPMSKTDMDTFTAQVLHEICHPLETNFAVWEEALRAGLGHLVNCLEDVRIEACGIARPVAVNARELLAAHSDRQVIKVMAQGWDPADPVNLPYTLKAYGRQRLNGYPMPSLPPLPAQIEKQWSWVFPELAACRSTDDVFTLARKIAKRSGRTGGNGGEGQKGEGQKGEGQKNEGQKSKGQKSEGQKSENQKNEDQKNKGQKNKSQKGKNENEDENESQKNEDQKNESEDENEGKNEDQKNKGQKGENQKNEDEKGEGEGEGGETPIDAPVKFGEDGKGESTGGTSATGGGQFKEYDDGIGAQVAAILRRSRTANFDAGAENDVAQLGKARPRNFNSIESDGSGSPKLRTIAGLIPNTAKLQADVRRLVKSPERVGVTRALSSGRFDRRSFTRAQAGAQNVFARKEYAPGVNAAVALVLDASSSMGDPMVRGGPKGMKARAAAALALAMGDALERARTPFEVSYAQSGYSREPDGSISPVHANPGQTFMVKGVNEPWKQRRERLGHAYNAGGTNNLGAAWGAAERLLQVPGATRRLVFVLSDGDCTYQPNAWRRAIAILAKRGVEVIGVGLMHDVSHSFPVYLNVTDPAALATQGLGLLVRQLESAGG